MVMPMLLLFEMNMAEFHNLTITSFPVGEPTDELCRFARISRHFGVLVQTSGFLSYLCLEPGAAHPFNEVNCPANRCFQGSGVLAHAVYTSSRQTSAPAEAGRPLGNLASLTFSPADRHSPNCITLSLSPTLHAARKCCRNFHRRSPVALPWGARSLIGCLCVYTSTSVNHLPSCL